MHSGFPVVVMALALVAQQQIPAPKFKASLDLVRVDVNVIDGQGRPIRDLTAADFEIRVDGRRRPIVSAQFVPVGGSVGVPATPTPPPADYTSNVDAVGGRLIMIVVDRTSIGTGRGKAAFESASRFLGGLNRADRVALATIPEGPQIDFTADHSLVQTKLQQIDGEALNNHGPRGIGVADALALERRDTFAVDQLIERECGAPAADQRSGGQSEFMMCVNQVKSEAALVASDARNRAQNSIIGLEALINRLPPSTTPKILVFISEGLVLDRERAQLAWLAPKAAAAHVTLYALHLMTSETDASRPRPAARYVADRALEEDGLALMTQATRGDVFRVFANSDFAFRRLALELSGYYLLGFEAEAGDRNGRPHEIKVDVRRKGVTVRSRREFTIGTSAAARTTEAEIVAALRDPLPSTDIPIKLTTFSFQDPRSPKLRLLVAAEIDRSVNPEGQLSVGFVLVDFNNKLVASQFDTTPSAALPQVDAGGTQHYFSAVVADPGKYTLKLVAIDDAGRRGSVERLVRAGLAKAGPIHATDLLVAGAASDQGDLPLAPAVSADLTGDTLHGYLELFADAPEPLELTSVTLEVAETPSSATLERAAVLLRKPEGDARCRIAGASVNIGKLPSGEYVARAVIAVAGRPVGQVVRPFRVARPGP